jgi:hypothetical protein
MNDKRILLYTTRSFESTLAAAALDKMIDKENATLDVEYINYLDFTHMDKFPDTHDIYVVLGLGYKGYALSEEFYRKVNTPFTELIHFSTWGKAIEADFIFSYVLEDQDPILAFIEWITEYGSKTLLFDLLTSNSEEWGTAKKLASIAQAYRSWTHKDSKATNYLLAMYNTYFTHLPEQFKGRTLKEALSANKQVIQAQMARQEEYLVQKAEQAEFYELDLAEQPVLMYVIFAESHINELANFLLQLGRRRDPEKAIVVLVGVPTKGSDRVSVRTHNISASQVAEAINPKTGAGKENVASAFLDVKYAELIGNTLHQYLTS